jgi:sulfur-oxidizing protein SoxA
MTQPHKLVALAWVFAAGVFFAAGANSQDGTAKGLQEYRDALKDGNPAELWEIKGEDMWKQPRGPNKATLEKCDLGLGPGVVKGAYARLPRYFKDTDRVDDLESRLVHCMVSLQGFTRADATRRVFGGPGAAADMEALVAYVTSQSRGVKMNVALNHPREREAFQMGQKLFNYRGGPHDFSCATCHGDDNKRIRLQDLPNLTKKKDAQLAYTTWPGYRVSQGELRTFQWRLYDCFRQQRFPELVYGSDVSVALTMYLARNANGATYIAPTVKR